MQHWKKLTICEPVGHFGRVECGLGLALAMLHTDVNTCFRISAVVTMKCTPTRTWLWDARPVHLSIGHSEDPMQPWNNRVVSV